MHNVRHGTVINIVDEATSYHYVVIFMLADVADPTQVPQNLEPDKCEGWEWHRWSEPLAGPVFKTLAAVRAMGFDPFAKVDASRIIHPPDDRLPPYCCAILCERSSGALLLEARGADAQVAAGQLTCFGGKREAGEEPLACIERELKEELGSGWAENTVSATTVGNKRKSADQGSAGASRLRRAVDLYVDGQLIAYFFEASAPARDTALCFEVGRTGVWMEGHALDVELDAAAPEATCPCLGTSISPWHACVLRAWRRGERRADFVTPPPSACK